MEGKGLTQTNSPSVSYNSLPGKLWLKIEYGSIEKSVLDSELHLHEVHYFWKAVTNHSQAASPLGEHSSVVLNYWLGKGRNYEKLSMHLMLTL